jgi:hypothetical protein
MCLLINKVHAIIEVANEDIVCYKQIVILNNAKGCFLNTRNKKLANSSPNKESTFRASFIKMHEILYTKMEIIRVDEGLEVHTGFHSFCTLDDCKSSTLAAYPSEYIVNEYLRRILYKGRFNFTIVDAYASDAIIYDDVQYRTIGEKKGDMYLLMKLV